MKKILLLATKWKRDFWESEEKAPYPNRKYTELAEWNNLSKNCPLPGIGRYIKGKDKDKDFSVEPFVYLEIKGMKYDPEYKQPCFYFKFLGKSNTKSSELEKKLSYKEFFFAMESQELIEILRKIGEEPPEDWKKLIEMKREITHWKDYIGKYFLEIEATHLSNDEFEDRVVTLLKALGFKVDQKGYKIPGEYPDGVLSFEDYAIVYDCKNKHNFIPSAEDKRAIEKYEKDERKIRTEKNIYCAFIAKSFKEKTGKHLYLSINSLLYLLYKKLYLGSKFTLSPLKKIFDNFSPLDKEIIDKEWLE